MGLKMSEFQFHIVNLSEIRTIKTEIVVYVLFGELFLSIHYKIAIKNLCLKILYLHINKYLCKFYKILARKHNIFVSFCHIIVQEK